MEVNPSNLLALRILLKISKKSANKVLFNLKEHSKLFDALSSNLCKNSRTLRLLSLNLLRRFEALPFLVADEEETGEQHAKTKPCDCFELMYAFEKTEISFLMEKNKQA